MLILLNKLVSSEKALYKKFDQFGLLSKAVL